MKLVSLRELALRTNIERRTLKRQLQALERDPALHGMTILVEARGKTWVKEHVLKLYDMTLELRTVSTRLEDAHSRLDSIESRVDALEVG